MRVNDQLAKRLENLERQNVRLKRCLALIAITFGALLIMAQTSSGPRTLMAEGRVPPSASQEPKTEMGIFLSPDNKQAILKVRGEKAFAMEQNLKCSVVIS